MEESIIEWVRSRQINSHSIQKDCDSFEELSDSVALFEVMANV